ncbi:MAG TPA: helix-turn-helix transcriptional regulator [Dehalococcoidia bacterium]|nr:helix-turn-helix transcriptional regulator [Dehalococcoidia bacterium]
MSNTGETAIMSFLRKLMEQQKRLPSQLAKDMGVSHPTFGRWLTGDDIPNTASCRKIADYSGVPVEEVLVMASHLDKIESEPVSVWPEFREYARLKYPEELDEDIIIVVEDLIERRLKKRGTTR